MNHTNTNLEWWSRRHFTEYSSFQNVFCLSFQSIWNDFGVKNVRKKRLPLDVVVHLHDAAFALPHIIHAEILPEMPRPQYPTCQLLLQIEEATLASCLTFDMFRAV
jgi:hypothetical protein